METFKATLHNILTVSNYSWWFGRIDRFPERVDLPQLVALKLYGRFNGSTGPSFPFLYNFQRLKLLAIELTPDTAVPYTLSAVLMTDTGPYRGNMRNCYHAVCDGPEVSLYSNPRSLKFLSKITQVLADTVTDMSQCEFDGASGRSGYRRDSNYIKTNRVHARSSAPRHGSQLKNLFNFVRWMHNPAIVGFTNLWTGRRQ